MGYITSWSQFQREAEALYAKSPNKARYCVKWRTVEGVLVLKITDDTTCLKYRTSSSVYLNRFEVLNHLLMEKMQNRRAPPPQPLRVPAAETPRSGSPALGAAAAKPGEAGGAGKKKGKKRK
ncbi:hypothetical protein FRB94_000914 [Tulasnella sp. JGI-2019a]|nr:hypothetical protein FRB93_002629 [Tulasnella sp. JGI-2019a]KAG9006219.1 hypothetical protein FRB94_000914 [Tulasnella sp. JGI-2019a]KAG9033315.1 hypothetical protein FRB95_000322 [Tulasnella sp. JGI-2019a]